MQCTESLSFGSARKILEIEADSDEKQVRAAYLQKVRQYPPDKSPEQFERIREAYEQLCDPKLRVREALFGCDPHQPLASLFSDSGQQRQFVGPELWLEALKESKSTKAVRKNNE